MRYFLLILGLLFVSSRPAFCQISLSVDSPRQGQVVVIHYKEEARSAPPVVHFNGQTSKLFQIENDSFEGLIAIPADLKPGSYKLKVGSEESSLKVQDGKFALQRLTLPKGKDNFVMSPGEKETVDEAKAQSTPEKFWSGKFVKPCAARQSTGFGVKRIVNGKLLTDYYHSGLDFAGYAGQPVYACAPGKVVLAHKGFKLHGNIVAIDHGQGVVSFYLHLQKIAVKEGDMVEAHEQIGNVGQTGRANGPHLHFSIYVNQTASNPIQWFTTII